MTPSPQLEARVAALIAAYADRAPAVVDPMAMTRLAADRSLRRGRAWLSDVPVSRRLGFGVVVMALLTAIVAGALAVGGQRLRGDPASVVATYGKIHLGWVFVYADGRVVWHPDLQAYLPEGATRYSILERRLTPAGFDLVRSGVVDPAALLWYELRDQLPESAWADPESRAYAPSSHAICYLEANEPIDASRVVGRLPAPAQALLRGKERTYGKTDAGLGDAPLAGCSEVTSDEAHILVDLLANAGFHAGSFVSGPDFLDAGSEGGYMWWSARPGTATEAEVRDPVIWFQPILPHGTWVFWGG